MADWTEKQAEGLRRWWLDGATASRIAIEISTKEAPVSRNAIIGKAHRMGLTGRSKPQAEPRKRVRSRATNRPKQPTAAADSPPSTPPQVPAGLPEPAEIDIPRCDIVSHGVGIAELKHDSCRWIEGSPSDAIYCGTTSEPQRSYCAAHVRMAYARRTS